MAIQVGGDILQEIIGVKGIIKDFNLAGCAWEVLTSLPGGKVLKGGKIVDKIVSAFKDTLTWMRRRDKAAADLRRVEEAQERLSKVTGCNSFAPGTLVLMADGSRRPIEQVRLGDRVLATDVATGENSPREVVATIIGQGWKRLVEITVAGQAPIVATGGHPFWVPSQRGWVDAEDLRAGDDLLVVGGAVVTVSAVRELTRPARVHNLTVDADHTFYAASGVRDVLVHNSGPDCRTPTGGKPGDHRGGEDFHGSEYSLDEMVEFVNGHVDDGNPTMGRPSRAQIESTLRNAGPVRLEGRTPRGSITTAYV